MADSGPRNPWLLAPLVALAAFMEVLDISIANVSLQHIAGDLSASQEEATWILTTYLVTNAIVLPISGWLSGLLGRKRFFMGCIAGFTASSLLCGLAPTLGLLIVFRVLQGATGGGLQPVSQAILADTFPPEQRGMAFAFYGMAVVFAPAIGPTLGGWITDNMSWRWVFLINVPVGVILVLLVQAVLPKGAAEDEVRRQRRESGFSVDWGGLALLAVGLGFLQVVLDRGQQHDWFDSNAIVLMSAVSALALIALVFWELRHRHPVVEFTLLRDPNFAIGNVLMFMVGFVLLASTVMIPLYVQSMLGYTATQAGLVISPGGFLIMFLMPVVGILTSRVDPRYLISFGLLLCAGSLWHMTAFNAQTDYLSIVVTRMVQAVGLAFLFIPVTNAAFASMGEQGSDNASAMINLSRNLGGSVGIAVVITILARSTQTHQVHLVSRVSDLDARYHGTAQAISQGLLANGGGSQPIADQTQAVIYNMVQGQAHMLAIIDDFAFMAVSFVALLPLVFLLRKGLHKVRGAAPAGAH